MNRHSSFKFLDPDVNGTFIRLLKKARIDHRVEDSGLVHYASDEHDQVDNDVISAVRNSVFPSWQLVFCPPEWTECYRSYMVRHRVPFVEELSNDEVCFLIPRRHRPHAWKMDGPKSISKKRRVAG
jgi:hypothetical protein